MDAHRDQGADVDWERDPLISTRHHVAHRVTAENRDTPLVQPRQAARVEAGHPLAKWIPSSFGFAPRCAAGADQQHVAFFHVNSLRLFGGVQIFGEDWSAGSSHSIFLRRGISSRTPRLTTPPRATSIAHFFAPREPTSLASKPLYILPCQNTWQSASRWVFAIPCGAIAK